MSELMYYGYCSQESVASRHFSPQASNHSKCCAKLSHSSWLLQLLKQFNCGLEGDSHSLCHCPLSTPLPWSRCFLSLCLLTELQVSHPAAAFRTVLDPLISRWTVGRWWKILHHLLSDRQNISTILSTRCPRQDWDKTLKWALSGFVQARDLSPALVAAALHGNHKFMHSHSNWAALC